MHQSTLDLILVGYRLDDTLASIRFCESAFATLLKKRRPVLVLNDERLRAQLPTTKVSWDVIVGSNRMAEFSGWQEGLDRLWERSGGFDHGVIFVNDSVVTHRRFRLPRLFATRWSMRSAHGAALVGFRDAVGSHFSIGDLDFDDWTSTYCFALTQQALERLEFRLYDSHKVQACVPGGNDEAKFFAGISPNLEHHLRNWLFGGGWYGSQRLGSSNRAAMELKARCIIAEKLLSAACLRLGIAPVDPYAQHKNLRRLDTLLERRQVAAQPAH